MSTLLLAVLSVVVAACAADRDALPDEQLAEKEQEAVCQPAELGWADPAWESCTGPWEYRTPCWERNPYCGPDPNVCERHKACPVATSFLDYTYQQAASCGKTKTQCILMEDVVASKCDSYAKQWADLARGQVPDNLDHLVTHSYTLGYIGCNGGWCYRMCNLSVRAPQHEVREDSTCGCAQQASAACSVPARNCIGPAGPTDFSPPGWEFWRALRLGDDAPRCTTCDDVSQPDALAQCLDKSFARLSVAGGDFEQATAGPVAAPWQAARGSNCGFMPCDPGATAVTVEVNQQSASSGKGNLLLSPAPTLWGSTWASATQTIPIDGERSYVLRARVRTDAKVSTAYVGAREPRGDVLVEVQVPATTTVEGYRDISLTFSAPTDASSVDVFVRMTSPPVSWDANWNAVVQGGTWTRVDDLRVEPVSGPLADPIRQSFVRKLKALYDLHADELSATLRARVAWLAFGQPGAAGVSLACGDLGTLPSIPTSCPAGAARDTYSVEQTQLERCKRLTQAHVLPDTASLELLGCIDILDRLSAARDDFGGSTDDLCSGTALRKYGREVTQALLRKQMRVMTETHPDAAIQARRKDLGALGRQLALLDLWYHAAHNTFVAEGGGAEIDDELSADLSHSLRSLWTAMYAHQDPFVNLRTAGANRALVNQRLAEVTGAGFTVDQLMIKAAFTSIGTLDPDGRVLDRPPLRGVPLLALLGDALHALGERADDLSVFHDFACTFRKQCGTVLVDTPVARTWQLLAGLGVKADIDLALTTSHELDKWKETFQTLSAQHGVLAEATQAIDGGLAAADLDRVAFSARPLAHLVQKARARRLSFAQVGQFEPTARRTLASGLDADSRTKIITDVESELARLNQARSAYNDGVVAMLGLLLGELDTQASADRAKNEKLRIAERWQALSVDLAGLHAAADAEERRFSDIVAKFADLAEALDNGGLYPTGDTRNWQFTGASARFSQPGSGDVRTWAAQSFAGLGRGQILMVNAGGQYRPSCALSQVKALSPVDGTANGFTSIDGASAAEALAGPEGYELTWSSGRYRAGTRSNGTGVQASVGVKAEVCVGTPPAIGAVSGLEAKACANFGMDYSRSSSESDSQGNESRAAASFAGGLRLGNTPFPTMPAGALLVVFANPSNGAIADVHVLSNGTSSLVVPADGVTAYFVVNDLGTCPADTSRQLSISAVTVVDAVTASQGAVRAMAQVLTHMRGLEQQMVGQGRLLPSQAAAARSEALALLDTYVNPENLPPQTRRLFEAFVDKEILRTERRIEMLQIRREMRLVELELDAIDQDLAHSKERSRVQALMTRWSARNLAAQQLRDDAAQLLRLVRSYFLPVLELWYPSAIDAFSLSPELDALLAGAELDVPISDLVDRAATALNVLHAKFRNAQRGQKPAGGQFPVIVVSFPNPDYQYPLGFLPSPYRRGEFTQWYSIWEAINGREKVTITVRPEDVYGQGDGTLTCWEHNPVVQKMALYVVRPGEPDYPILNGLNRSFDSWAGITQMFAQKDGPATYTIVDGVWQFNSLPIVYGEAEAVQTNVLGAASVLTQRPVGLSPFASFEVDFGEIAVIEGAGGSSGFDEWASELLVVMQVDSRAAATPLGWVDSCNP